MESELTRRRLLALGLAVPTLGLALARAESLLAAAPLAATLACDDGDDPQTS